MKYELDLYEPPADGMRRIVLECVELIQALMTDSQLAPEKAVHEARKTFKRIRAALRLVRDETGDSYYRRENVFYRDASRLLAPIRDSTVLIETLDKMSEAYTEQLPERDIDALRGKLLARHEGLVSDLIGDQDVLGVVARRLEENRSRVLEMPIESSDFSAFEGGLRRVYRRGRGYMDAAYSEPNDPVQFHEWRKQVKYLWHHLDILRPAWPLMLNDLADELHSASDFLGDAHDLVALSDTLRAERRLFGAEAALPVLLALAGERRRELESACRTLGQRLYFEKPRAFSARVAAYWDAWQQDWPETREALQESLAARERLPGMVGAGDAGRALGISPRAVLELIRAGELQAAKVGGIWVISESSLADFQRS